MYIPEYIVSVRLYELGSVTMAWDTNAFCFGYLDLQGYGTGPIGAAGGKLWIDEEVP